MKKSDLKPGMVIECLNGERYLVLSNCFVNNNGYNLFRIYDKDLDCTDCIEFSIMRVYDVIGICTCLGDIFQDSNLKLIWERGKESEETLELTLEDIAEKFKVDVNSIKIKK